jgi:hypothetical protein
LREACHPAWAEWRSPETLLLILLPRLAYEQDAALGITTAGSNVSLLPASSPRKRVPKFHVVDRVQKEVAVTKVAKMDH